MSSQNSGYYVSLNIASKFLYSTSGSQSSIEKHNEALKMLGLNLVYFTFPDEISPEAYAALLRSPIARGGAVTGKGGLKSTIIPFLDDVESLALKTLAVNTVVNNGGNLCGYNTDAFGLKTALMKGIKASDLEVKTAVIYGNGGVSGVAFHVLQELGIKVAMVGRNQERVLKKKKALGIASIEHFEGPYDLIVDATPISASPDFLEAKGFAELLDGSKMLFCHNMPEKDNKINHLQAYCNKKQIHFIPGKWMYDAQLIKQFQLYFEGYKQVEGKAAITEMDIVEAWSLHYNQHNCLSMLL